MNWPNREVQPHELHHWFLQEVGDDANNQSRLAVEDYVPTAGNEG